VGMMNSVEEEMRTQFGVSGLIEECSLLISITKIVENYGSSLQAGQELTVKCHCLAGKLELVFLTGEEDPNVATVLRGPVVGGA
jgi:hypothetical protein